MEDAPKQNGEIGKPEGRDPVTGRFALGWKGGPGNPYAKQVSLCRKILYEVYTEDEMRGILVKAREFLKDNPWCQLSHITFVDVQDRMGGKAVDQTTLEILARLQALEESR